MRAFAEEIREISYNDEEPATLQDLKASIKEMKLQYWLPINSNYGNTDLQNWIHNLIAKIWLEESVPTVWNDGLLISIFKTPDPTNCIGYRGIMLQKLL